jgi:hypothetical protein
MRFIQPTAMITCHRSYLEARCVERGYTLDEVLPCVVSQDGDEWTIDTESEFYPRVSRLPSPPAPSTHGPGTELKKLLARVGIIATPDCSCNARAAEMDRREQETPGWCEANLDTIVGWLREQAEARGLPFLDLAGRLLVRRAIQNARKMPPT